MKYWWPLTIQRIYDAVQAFGGRAVMTLRRIGRARTGWPKRSQKILPTSW